MGSTADWWYKERLPELQREEEEKAKLKKEKEGMEQATTINANNITSEGEIMYDQHTSEFLIGSNTSKIEIDLSDINLLYLTKQAHSRNITLNNLINEIMHDTIQRDYL